MNLLLLLLLAHILADYPLQFDAISIGKRSGRIGNYALHFGMVAATSLILTIPYWSAGLVSAVMVIAATHAVIDWVKNRILRGNKTSNELLLFTIDQLAHIGVIVLTACYLISQPRMAVTGPEFLFPGIEKTPWTSRDSRSMMGTLALAVAVVYSYAIFGGSIFVRKVLDMDWIRLPVTSLKDPPERTLTIGRYIGMAERALLITFVALGAYGAVGFVLAAKSIARFKDLEDRNFAEYYLIGTLTSSCIAVAGGLVLRGIYLFLI